jgi:glyoxylase-like metal-dependent hydrolase (beta-lactamase superfamily II)
MQLLDLPLHKIIVPTPFHVGPVNVYVITEPEVAMIDVGPKMPESRTAIEQGLREISLSIADVKKIFITHGHPDHYGQAAELARDSTAAVLASPLDSPHFQHRTHSDFYLRMYEEAGVPQRIVTLFEAGFQFIQHLTDPIQEYVPVREGDAIPCGRSSFEVVATPGHTPGSLSFFSREQRLLIAADTVIKRITPNPILDEDPFSPGERYPSLMNYLASLEKLKALDPELVCSGHGDEVNEFQPLYEKMLSHHEERQARILSLVHGASKTLWCLALDLFPQVGEHGMFLALSEVYAHVDLLESRSRIRSEVKNGVRMIEAVGH